jgi:hypothetical protein
VSDRKPLLPGSTDPWCPGSLYGPVPVFPSLGHSHLPKSYNQVSFDHKEPRDCPCIISSSLLMKTGQFAGPDSPPATVPL